MSNGSTTQASAHKPARTTFHLLAGLASGVSTSILLQPADLLKTRIQQSPSSTLLSTLRSILSSPKPVKQLWRGALPSVIRTGVGSALYFTALNGIRTELASLQHHDAIATAIVADHSPTNDPKSSSSSSVLPKLSPLANLASGALARVSVGFIMMPITVLKVRFESSYYASYGSLGLFGAARDLGAKEGIRGFFAGFGATAVRDAPYAGLYVVFYEAAKSRLGALASARVDPTATGGLTGATSAMVNLSSGALAASAATAITNPPDAVKTRLQLMPARYGNSMRAVRMMWREEGVRCFFDGLGLRMARKAVSSALAWTVYEEVIRRVERGFLDG
ncbi:MAG: hypothetical protein M1828_004484 [Chrysothrix sp. TS-e1954]|nr:MAG: hypothetical protein M1828_004484 [Chrysothrix sp. TS-e1954]